MASRPWRDRRWVAASGVVVVAAVAGLLAWQSTGGDSGRISSEELGGLPTIVFTWAQRQRATMHGAGDLYLVRADETEPRLLRRWPGQLRDLQVYGAGSVGWSPDRKQIALTLGWWIGDPYSQVAVVSVDGRRLQKLYKPRFQISDLTWSPDGRTLLYGTDEGLRTVSPIGGKTVLIRPVPDSGWLTGAKWSPDGQRIVASTGRGIITLASDGRTLARLTDSSRDVAPAWSPDGRSIAFIREEGCFAQYEDCPDPANVWVVGADGKGLRQLTRRVGATSLAWSPAGDAIAFGYGGLTVEDQGGIGLVRPSGGGGAAHISLIRDGFPADWSPDGHKLLFYREAFERQRHNTWSELWVMDADGGRPTRLPFNRPKMSVISVDWR